MATIDLTAATFEETIRTPGIVFVDFWATWCGPCAGFGPFYFAASETHPDIVFGKVDVDEVTGLSSTWGIQAIPSLLAFRDGLLIYRTSGAIPPSSLEDLITEMRNLDMDEIRAEVARSQAAAEESSSEERE